ncbi:MAG: hypothetical protein BWY06_02579 [Candidatus Latescibacteria bacterium ADurb.Bin168]|nr:MAG: hypothetical protein BWY06_02579 [Candidatus Latescibacteria bacterium ADurb.Bin168]
MMSKGEALIPAHGGYRHLKSFRVGQLVYDLTVRFCDTYIERQSRAHDQMVQAARSGVQNVAEGSQASGASKKMELKLTNVVRARLEELRLDYEDFLSQRDLPLWERTDQRRQSLVDARPATADDVGRWAKRVREGSEHSGRNGPGRCLERPRCVPPCRRTPRVSRALGASTGSATSWARAAPPHAQNAATLTSFAAHPPPFPQPGTPMKKPRAHP